MKSKLGIIADDVCSLPQPIINNNNIEVVKVKWEFPELDQVPEQNLYQVMKETKSFPKTSAPAPGDFLSLYKQTLDKFEKVIVITLSSKLSAVYDAAFQAKQVFGSSNIKIFDSLTAAVPEGLLVLKAAHLAQQGKETKEVLGELKKYRNKAQMLALVEDPDWVANTGRASPIQVKVFKFLKGIGVHPLIKIKKGKVRFGGLELLTNDPVNILFRRLAKKAATSSNKIRVGINYTDNEDLALQLKEKIIRNSKMELTFVSLAPPVIGASTGPGTIIAGYSSFS